MVDPVELLTTAEAAARLGVASNSVLLWAEAGLLQSWRSPGGQSRISARSVQDVLDERQRHLQAQRQRLRHVLLLEDDESASLLLTLQLHELLPDAQVHVVRDGCTAIGQARRDLPDLLVLNVDLLGMKSVARVQSLRDQQDTKDLPLLLVSSFRAHELRRFGEALENVPFLSRPITMASLRYAMDRILSPSGAAGNASARRMTPGSNS